MLRAKAREMLAHPTSVAVEPADGQSVTIKPARWNFQTAAVMALRAVEIQAAVLAVVDRDRPLEEMSDIELRAVGEAILPTAGRPGGDEDIPEIAPLADDDPLDD